MAIRVSTRTIHTIEIDISDDALGALESGDEVEVVLHSRFGSTSRRRLAYRDQYRLTEDSRR